MNNVEKRFVDTYEVINSIEIGKQEILLGKDVKKELQYMVCYSSFDNPLGFEQFYDAVASKDYLEMLCEYSKRITQHIETLTNERSELQIPLSTLTIEDCYPDNYKESIVGKLVAIKPEILKDEYKYSHHQICIVKSGFGAEANSRGRAVFVKRLFDGKESRWNREDILGEVVPDRCPAWAKEKLIDIKNIEEKQKTKEVER